MTTQAPSLLLVAIVVLSGSLLPAAEIQLDAKDATIHGSTARFLVLEGIGNICYWTNAADWLSWDASQIPPGEYVVELRYSCDAGAEGSRFTIAVGDAKLECRLASPTGSWYDHEILALGTLTVRGDAPRTLSLRPTEKPGQAVMNLTWLRLIPRAGHAAYLAATAKEHARGPAALLQGVRIVSNFHPASCGWLTDFSTERNYCAGSYLAHLDRVRDDSNYRFVLSEVNNLMAILAFEPARFEELKRRVAEGRVECVNAFFLEPSINLSGGEALVKMGIEGLRWQEEVMGVRPRAAWMIDVTGVHEQMGQIVSALGLDAIVYTRDNPTASVLHWLESPDGSRALAICAGHYSDWGEVFSTPGPLSSETLRGLVNDARAKARRTPADVPVLVLGGGGDYSLPPARKDSPTAFLSQWKEAAPDVDLRFSTLSSYLDLVLPVVRSDAVTLPVSRSGARLSWWSFWIQNPTVKQAYRRAEHALQSAEAVATVASLGSAFSYPVQPLYHAWLEMCLNMDRNTLWGAAGGMVFENKRSWDVKDRFASVEAIAAGTVDSALRSLLSAGDGLAIFDALHWKRSSPVAIRLPASHRPRGIPSQSAGDEGVLCRPDLGSYAITRLALEPMAAVVPAPIPVPLEVRNAFYRAKIDPHTGRLVGLRLEPSGKEILAGAVDVVAESGMDGHNTPPRDQRKRLAVSGACPAEVTASEGPVATTIEARLALGGQGNLRRWIRFYRESPRIDFDFEISDVPDKTVVVTEFPLANDVGEVRRGIPYGFSHGTWPKPSAEPPGLEDGILAAIRWSHYQFAGGGGVAIFDRGLPGREITGRVPLVFLLNAQETYLGYPCKWLSGKGPTRASLALFAHEGSFVEVPIQRMAWEFNAPPLLVSGVAAENPAPANSTRGLASSIETSPNVIVEALRRDGPDIELRMVECLGLTGRAKVLMSLPHAKAFRTDLVARRSEPLAGGPSYELPIRAQEIVTLRFRVETPVEKVAPLTAWDSLVPPSKLDFLRRHLPGRKGHPPLGTGVPIPELPAEVSHSLTASKSVTASNVYRGLATHAPEMAVDGDPATRWATDEGISQATLEVDLGELRTVGRAFLSEGYDRVRAFQLEALTGEEWQVFARGGKIGTELPLEFPPVKARKVRLHLTDAPGGPTIWEFHLFAPAAER